MSQSPLIHSIPPTDLQAEFIEQNSLQQIQNLVPQKDWSDGEWRVICRMVHTCGDPSLADDILFHNNPIPSGIHALERGAPIYLDSQMQRGGISLARLQKIYPSYSSKDLHCHVADTDIAEKSQQQKMARSLFAIRKAKPILNGGIVCVGNAPVALLELNRMILEENIQPALVIGVPVGFVHVLESKRELENLSVPSIILKGRRGGSALAVAALHAIAIQANLQRNSQNELF